MNRRNHLIPCLMAAAVAIALLTTIGGNPLAAGLGVAFLLCPIVMGGVMWLLMRQPKSAARDRQLGDSAEQPTTSARP